MVERQTPVSKNCTLIEKLSKTDLGPLVILFSLFITGFCLFAGFTILIVSMWYPILGAIIIAIKLVGLAEIKERWILYRQRKASKGNILKENVKWMVILKWWLPHEHRDAIMGDILEDYQEMRENGSTKRQIRTHILWQWVVAVVRLEPSSFVNAIARIWHTP